MLCDKCKKNEATYHTVRQINGIVSQMHLCPQCKDKLARAAATENNPNRFTNFMDDSATRGKCPHCGLTHAQLMRTGKIGCEQCYVTFSDVIARQIRAVQIADTHEGKRPLLLGDSVHSIKQEYDRLRTMLSAAATRGDYAQTVKIKRMLAAIKQQMTQEDM